MPDHVRPTAAVTPFNPTPLERTDVAIVVAGRAPATAGVIGVPVADKGAVPRQLGVDRATLAASGFDGKVGQTLVVPRRDGATLVAVGIGDPADPRPTAPPRRRGRVRPRRRQARHARDGARRPRRRRADVAGQAVVEGCCSPATATAR